MPYSIGSPEALREIISPQGSEKSSIRHTARSVDKKKSSMSATGFYPSPSLTYTEVKEKQDAAYSDIKKTLKNTNLRELTNRSQASKRIEDAIKVGRPPKDFK